MTSPLDEKDKEIEELEKIISDNEVEIRALRAFVDRKLERIYNYLKEAVLAAVTADILDEAVK